MSGFFHYFYHTVERHAMVSVGERRVGIGVKGTGSGVGVSFDAGNLHQSAHRVARHAQVVFQPHLGSIFYLCGTSTEELACRCSRHRACHAYFCLASGFGSRYRGVMFDDISYQSCGGKGTQDAGIAELPGFL